jgi:flagellar basal body-associated protein FliL
MAEDAKKDQKEAKPAAGGAPAASGGDGTPAKKKSMKTIGIVAAIMVLEAVGVFFVVSATGKRPESAEAHEIKGGHEADLEKSVELPLLGEKFQSMQGSQVWIWDTEMVLKIKKKNEEFVTKELERQESEIKEAVATIFRKAQPSQLREPGLDTVNSQVTAYISKVLGKDAEGKERFERLMIPKCKGFSTN